MKRFIIILLAGFAVVFGAATTAEAGGYGCRTYYRSHCGPSYYRSYHCAPRYHYRSYGYCAPRYYGGSYGYCAPRYYGGSYGYYAPRYYHGGITVAIPGFGFHFCH
jgi:hypothetical protein